MLKKLISKFIGVGLIKTSHLGFAIAEPIHYLLEKERFRLDFFCKEDRVANMFLLKLLRRRFLIVPNWFYQIAQRLGLNIKFRSEQYFDIYGLKEKSDLILKLSEEELKEGRDFLQKIGVEGKYVVFSTRDRSFHSSTQSQNDQRNVDPKTYKPALEYLISKGFTVFRLGSTEDVGISHPNFIDYINLYRSDFLDIFLCSTCEFYLGDSGGLVWVPRIFKRPVVLTNWIPIGLVNTASSRDLIIFKRLKRDGKFLTLNEQLSDSFFEQLNPAHYAEIEIIDNSPEEIKDAVIEMVEGADQLTDQSWFWKLNNSWREPIRARIGTEFLDACSNSS